MAVMATRACSASTPSAIASNAARHAAARTQPRTGALGPRAATERQAEIKRLKASGVGSTNPSLGAGDPWPGLVSQQRRRRRNGPSRVRRPAVWRGVAALRRLGLVAVLAVAAKPARHPFDK
jgi:hypothetical protein